jgi:hypothetical protein
MDDNHLSINPENTFEDRKLVKMLSCLTDKTQELIKELKGTNEKDRKVVITELFRLEHKEGLLTDFKAALLILIKKIADAYMVELKGKCIIIKFPIEKEVETIIEIVDLQPPITPIMKPTQNGNQDGQQIDITVTDVHRNEQVNIVALCQELQTILCSELSSTKYYALVPQRGGSTDFTLSQEGEEYQCLIRGGYGIHLELFPRIFIARLYARSFLTNNTVEFWADMKKAGLFRYWDPEKGPYAYYRGKSRKEVQMLRVYKVDYDLKPFILETNKYRHALEWRGGNVSCHGAPVLDDNQMKQQLDKFNEILRKHGNAAASVPN